MKKSAAEIQLSVRIRPFLNVSQNINEKSAVDVDKMGKVIVKGDNQFSFQSHVVKGSNQEVAFEALASQLIDRVSLGYNCTLIAYGQTGSGKTYTMFGPPGCLTSGFSDSRNLKLSIGLSDSQILKFSDSQTKIP